MCYNYDISEYYELVYAVIKTESNFNPSEISSTNDYGLMQINVVNHNYLSNTLGIVDFLDPYQNVQGGIYLLASLLHKYDNINRALMAYNMGEAGAATLWSRGKTSTQYTEAVLSNYKEYI
jgi:soluble lytic murein transglycosylase-like protein